MSNWAYPVRGYVPRAYPVRGYVPQAYPVGGYVPQTYPVSGYVPQASPVSGRGKGSQGHKGTFSDPIRKILITSVVIKLVLYFKLVFLFSRLVLSMRKVVTI